MLLVLAHHLISHAYNIIGESAPSERQVSPEKQYRAALLRSRFADTILKAREKALEKVCPTFSCILSVCIGVFICLFFACSISHLSCCNKCYGILFRVRSGILKNCDWRKKNLKGGRKKVWNFEIVVFRLDVRLCLLLPLE